MTELYVHTSGDPASPAIVFLHGGGVSGRMWQPQLEELTEYYCLAPDLPEHARSAASKPFALPGAAAEVAKLIRERIPNGRAHLVGLSVGGAVGLEVLRTQPTVVQRAILSGTTPKLGRGLALLIELINLPLLKLLRPDQLARMVIKSLSIPAAYQPLIADDLKQLNANLFRNINRAMTEVQIPHGALPPTLVVVGEKEMGMAKNHARAIRKSAQGVTGMLVKGAGHGWNFEDPDLFNKMVRAWLTAQALPAALQPLPDR